MTREEAKALLMNISAYDIDTQRGLAKQEAIDMAIKALEQEPCGDAISRQEAVDALEDWFYSDDERKPAEVLSCLPSVTPKGVTVTDFADKCRECGREKVLDEIRAEIEEQVLESLSDGGDDWFAAEKVNECLEIIDRYKTESEGQE